MRVKIRLFAGLRDVAGSELEERFDGDSVTVAELQRRLRQSRPELCPYLSTLAIAVNEEYIVDDQQLLHDCDEVALIPPISGGADAVPHFLVTPRELDPRSLRELVRTGRSGAVVIFEGVVRDRHDGHDVLRLEYQAYGADGGTATGGRRQRRGSGSCQCTTSRSITASACSRSARPRCWSRCRRSTAPRRSPPALRVVDRVKESVPVWKKEFTPDGAVWQEGLPARPAR